VVDRLTKERRSWLMSRIGGKNTEPEIAVRKIVHNLGFRFRLHYPSLAGTPDLVLPRLRTAMFVHGCFWHHHIDCSKASLPKTRRAYWQAKFEANVARDELNRAKLKRDGWRVVVVWQCELRDSNKLKNRLKNILERRRLHSTQEHAS
jgi:DNA mismatch endonuclease (patch repair protein)